MLRLQDTPMFVKLLAPVGLLFLLVGAILVVNNVNTNQLLDGQRNLVSNGIDKTVEIAELLERFQTIDSLFYRYLIEQSTGSLDNPTAESNMAGLKKQAMALDASMTKIVKELEGEDAITFEALQKEFRKNVIGLQDDGIFDVAIQMMSIDVGFVLKGIGGYTQLYNRMLKNVKNLKASIKNSADALATESERDIENTKRVTLITSAILSIGSMLLCVGMIYMVVISIKDISARTANLAEGDVSVDLDSLSRKDELGSIVESLAQFKENQIRVQELTAEQERLKQQQEEDRKKEMRGLADDFDVQIGSMINSLADSSEKMQVTAKTMRSIADETSSATQTVASSSELASANVNTVAAAMEEMSASSSEIATQIGSARKLSNDTSTQAQATNESVQELNALVSNIGEVVVAIQDIAEQTNLLALNATIEAARAGEAGRGFAVVADEVKKLASETSQKTEEVGQRISEIQQATTKSVNAMDQIIHNISNIDDVITSVSASADEQNSTNLEIVRSVSEASQGVQQVTNTILEVQTGAGETGNSAEVVLSAVNELSSLSSDLKESVSGFLQKIKNG